MGPSLELEHVCAFLAGSKAPELPAEGGYLHWRVEGYPASNPESEAEGDTARTRWMAAARTPWIHVPERLQAPGVRQMPPRMDGGGHPSRPPRPTSSSRWVGRGFGGPRPDAEIERAWERWRAFAGR